MHRNQLSRVTKEELIDVILSSSDQTSEVALQALTQQVTTLVQEVTELKKALTSQDNAVNQKINDLQSQVAIQAETIKRQQRFLENLDRKERECNLVILGVPEEQESLDGATNDTDKIQKVWGTIGVVDQMCALRRLGNASVVAGNRKRPILITLSSRNARDAALDKAKKLKSSGDQYSRIYVKKDVHPSVREEWKRLRSAEKTERERPENVGCSIRLDTRERKLYKDDVVIDAWSLQGF